MRKAEAGRVMFYLLLVVIVAGASNVILAQLTGESLAWREMNHRARQVEPMMREAARLYGVDPRALWTIAYLETRFRPALVSPKGARGMMQFMPATAARFGLGNPHDTAAAINAAARYVRFLSDRYNGRFELVLAGYNAGEGAVDAYLRGVTLRTSDGRIINRHRISTGGVPPFTETRNYVARGLQVMHAVAASKLFSTTEVTVARPLLVTSTPHIYQPQHSALVANPKLSKPVSPATAGALQTAGTPASRYAVSNMPQQLNDEDSSTLKGSRSTTVRPRSFRVNAVISWDAPPPQLRSVWAQK
ncbi:MAG: transglycosylase SLT domain-containing protein [Acidobacteriota bacterium]|nr:transglycosylase SLT domain-containing protein [Acidobacteriota bacterium]